MLEIPDTGQPSISILFQWTYKEAAYNSEVGVYLVDEQGRVNGIAPDDPNYARTVLSEAPKQILFSPNQQTGNWQQLQIPGGSRLAFYLIADSTSANWLANNNNSETAKNAFFSVNRGNTDGFDHSRAENLGARIWRLSWEDLINGGDQDFNDVVFTVSQPGLIVPGGVRQKVPLDINWVSQDRYANVEMGFFFVDDAEGRIGQLRPGDVGYAKAALDHIRRQTVFSGGQPPNGIQFDLSSGQYIGWYLISGGTTQQWLNTNPDNSNQSGPVAFFSYPSANPDGLSHLHYQTAYQLGWETTLGGGDRDYDDLVFRFQWGNPTGEADNSVSPGLKVQPPITDPPVTDPPIKDPPIDSPLPSLSINDISLTEGDNGTTNATFTVSLSQSSLKTVSVAYSTEDRTAIAPGDYQQITGQITFAPGETQKSLTIAVNGDEKEEIDEIFALVLSQPINAVIDDGEGIATIIDNDEEDPVDDPTPIPDIVLTEGQQYLTTHQQSITIPKTPSVLKFTYSQLNFDTTDPDSINDGFEVALLDSQGNSLVHTIAVNHDAFFNLTEGLSPTLANGVTINGQTVTINLSEITANPSATLVFRLINNDKDSTTTVTISDIGVEKTTLNNQATFSNVSSIASLNETLDFEQLENVSNSIKVNYGRTSVNEETQVLYTDLAVENKGNYPLRNRLLVAITNLSNPSVSVIGFDGKTPEGLPYFDLSHLIDIHHVSQELETNLKEENKTIVKDEIETNLTEIIENSQVFINQKNFSPGESTEITTLSFYNPNKIQFTYDLVFLGQLNQSPVWISQPDTEIKVSKSYKYQLKATDSDGDTLTYKLLVAPSGLILNETNKQLTWTPTSQQIGNHNIILEVSDGQGGTDQQTYTLAVVKDVPNRPPLITSTPEVDSFVNTKYIYQVIAKDIDGDNLTYQLIEGSNGETLPDGITINQSSGLIEWTPKANQLGKHQVTVVVKDEVGGLVKQTYTLQVQPQIGNHNPIIVSQPQTHYEILRNSPSLNQKTSPHLDARSSIAGQLFFDLDADGNWDKNGQLDNLIELAPIGSVILTRNDDYYTEKPLP